MLPAFFFEAIARVELADCLSKAEETSALTAYSSIHRVR